MLTSQQGRNMQARSIAAGISVVFFAWQSCFQAQAACQNIDAAICGSGNGSFSTVSGDILVGRNGGLSPAISGASILAGDRILVRSGAVQLTLGPSCTASVAPGSMATVTQQKNLTCLHGNVLPQTVGADLPTHKPPPPPTPVAPVPVAPAAFDPALIAGVLVVGTGVVACTAFCFNHNENNHEVPVSY